jgi:hypothetical protein
MRINVYSEELTDECEWVSKTVNVEKTGEMVTFYGIRVFLKSAPELHQGDDDDRSAITFWIPWTKADGYNFRLVDDIFAKLRFLLDDASDAADLAHG